MSPQTALLPPNSRLEKNIQGLIYFIVCIHSRFQYSISPLAYGSSGQSVLSGLEFSFCAVYLKSFSYLFYMIFKRLSIQQRERVSSPLWTDSSASSVKILMKPQSLDSAHSSGVPYSGEKAMPPSQGLFQHHSRATGTSTLIPCYDSCISVHIAGYQSTQNHRAGDICRGLACLCLVSPSYLGKIWDPW